MQPQVRWNQVTLEDERVGFIMERYVRVAGIWKPVQYRETKKKTIFWDSKGSIPEIISIADITQSA